MSKSDEPVQPDATPAGPTKAAQPEWYIKAWQVTQRGAVRHVEPFLVEFVVLAWYQCPLILFGCAMLGFSFTDQGSALATLPWTNPWTSSVVLCAVSLLVFICWLATLMSRHWVVRPMPRFRMSVVFCVSATFGLLLCLSFPRETIGWFGTALLFSLSLFLTAAVCAWYGANAKPDEPTGPPRTRVGASPVRATGTGTTPLTATVDAGSEAELAAVFRIIVVFLVFFYTAISLGLGAWVAGEHPEWFVDIGPYATAYAGLALVTIVVQLFLVVLPRGLGSAVFGLVVVAGFVACLALQKPLTDRKNPLLEKAAEKRLGRPVPAEALRETTATDSVSLPLPANALTDCKSPLLEIDSPKTVGHQVSKIAPCRTRFVVSAEGGGIRAAYWTAMVLNAISAELGEDFRKQVELVSGVSGGSLGLATWMAAQELAPGQRHAAIKAFLSQDFLSPLIGGLLFVDAPRLVLWTGLSGKHRGDHFEALLASRWFDIVQAMRPPGATDVAQGADYFYRPLDSLVLMESEALIFFNATDALSGAYVGLRNAKAREREKGTALDLQIWKRLEGLRVAQAVHTSARFFYLSPHPDLNLPVEALAASLVPPASVASSPEKKPLPRAIIDGIEAVDPLGLKKHLLKPAEPLPAEARAAALIDGGYFDNSGLGPVIRHVKSAGQGQPPLHVIHIVNDQQRACAAYTDKSFCKQWSDRQLGAALKTEPWAWLTRPVEAIFATRGEHALQRLNELGAVLDEKRVHRLYLPPPGSSIARAQSRPASSPDFSDMRSAGRSGSPADREAAEVDAKAVALGWMLTPADTNLIDASAKLIASCFKGGVATSACGAASSKQ